MSHPRSQAIQAFRNSRLVSVGEVTETWSRVARVDARVDGSQMLPDGYLTPPSQWLIPVASQ